MSSTGPTRTMPPGFAVHDHVGLRDLSRGDCLMSFRNKSGAAIVGSIEICFGTQEAPIYIPYQPTSIYFETEGAYSLGGGIPLDLPHRCLPGSQRITTWRGEFIVPAGIRFRLRARSNYFGHDSVFCIAKLLPRQAAQFHSVKKFP